MYPVLYSSSVSNQNRQLIITGIDELLESTTSSDIKEIIDKLQKNYNQEATENKDIFDIAYLDKYLKI
jgi:hypothetical protein